MFLSCFAGVEGKFSWMLYVLSWELQLFKWDERCKAKLTQLPFLRFHWTWWPKFSIFTFFGIFSKWLISLYFEQKYF